MIIFYKAYVSESADWIILFSVADKNNRHTEVIVNDAEKLKEFYRTHSGCMYVGYGSSNYDKYIVSAALMDINVKSLSDFILVKAQPGWKYSSLLNEIKIANYDVSEKSDSSLNELSLRAGNSLNQLNINCDGHRRLNDNEIQSVVNYLDRCVDTIINVFCERIDAFNVKLQLVQNFRLELRDIEKTTAKMVSKILDGKSQHFDDEFDFKIVDTLDAGRYAKAREWYEDNNNRNYNKSQVIRVHGLEAKLGWGGMHAAKKQYKGAGLYVLADVTAYYPSLMSKYGFGLRNMTCPGNFTTIHNENLRLKQLGDNNTRQMYKIADNCVSGQLKDKYSSLYDPCSNNSIVVNGQLLILDLIDKIESSIDDFELIQINTDGILLRLNSEDDFYKLDDVAYEWESRTGMKMDFTVFKRIWQKDVNNYIMLDEDWVVKTRGAYVQKMSELDNDMYIVNHAVIEYITHGTKVEDTINNCNELWAFQHIAKLTGRNECFSWNSGKIYSDCVRVFASRDRRYSDLTQCHKNAKEKVADTSDSCVVYNDPLPSGAVPDWLDKNWYIRLAKERIKSFGVYV